MIFAQIRELNYCFIHLLFTGTDKDEMYIIMRGHLVTMVTHIVQYACQRVSAEISDGVSK